MSTLPLCIRVLFNSQPTLVTNSFFSNAQLKPRIQMLINPKTNRWVLWKYALMLPLSAILAGITVSCDRVAESLTGNSKITLEGQVVDSRQKPVSGVTVYVQTPIGNFATNQHGQIERTGGIIKTNQYGRYRLTVDRAGFGGRLEFIHPAYLVSVLPLKKIAFNGQVRLFTVTEALKAVNEKRADELMMENRN